MKSQDPDSHRVDPEFYPRYVALGSYVALMRKQKGMNQDAFAEYCGVATSTIGNLEAPKVDKTFELDTLFRIARALGVDIVDMLSFELPKLGN